MVLAIFNSLGRKKEAFKPLEKDVRMYVCGPTTYDYAHIGNWRSFIFSDILRRYLMYLGFNVREVMNVTDVDDKTIKGSLKQGVMLNEYTKKYEQAFLDDMKTLNIIKPDIMPRATEHIKEMVELIKKLEKNRHTYKSDGSTYFKISTFRDYGKLSGIKLDEVKSGCRIDKDEYEKEDARDFVLWKATGEDEEKVGAVWETPFGKGRPGWHIECSAMSMKYLGETLDIHTGGVDLIFPHHENEIAQSECATGKQFVRYWLHCAHLIIEGEKMSKSKGNFFTLRDLIEKGHDPRALRYFLLSAHHRSPINLTTKALQDAKNSVGSIDNFMDRLRDADGKVTDESGTISMIADAKKGFEKAMNDDLNMPNALSALFEFMRCSNRMIDEGNLGKQAAKKIHNQMLEFDKVLGIIKFRATGELTEDEKKLVEKREKFRKEKKFKEADIIREQLKKKGVLLEDKPDGVRWKRV
ncbi:MAG: cysteine--tRNA ligase [Candidatus Aenigmarchaeota archaeon]|nr:cysteine--tRNA ligase [Candidatus Aenigmarchaeota archaeon]